MSNTKESPKLNGSKPVGLLVTLLSAILMGIYPSAARWSYQLGANSTFIVLVTTFSRLFFLLVSCGVTQQTIFKRNSTWRPIVWGGVLQAVSGIGILSSVAFIPGPVALTILFTHTLMLFGVCVATGEEKFTLSALICTVSALVGVSLVVGLWSKSPDLNIAGLSLASMAAVATMGRAYLFGHQVKNDHPMVVGAWTFVIAFPLTWILIPIYPPTLPATAVGFGAAGLAALSLGLGTIATFYGIYWLGAFQFSLFLKLEPIFTALFSIVILHEFLSPGQYIGMVIVLASLVVYQLFVGRRARS